MKNNNSKQTLSQGLSQIKSDFYNSADDVVKEIIEGGIEEVAEGDLLRNTVNVGQKGPDFTLSNAVGQKVSLSSRLQKGPVVLTWYRGGWCPFCNLQLQFLQKSLPEMKALGASLIALTPERPDASLSTKEKHELSFDVLSDIDNQVAKKYGIIFKLNEKVSVLYKNTFSLDLEAYNGNDSDELPLAATYVIDQSGIVKYAFLTADYTTRAESQEIIEALKAI